MAHRPGYWYAHNPEAGMEYWHDGEFQRRQCHDGVGLITEHHQSEVLFLAMCDEQGIGPDWLEDE